MKYPREVVAVALRILTELGRRRRSLILWAVFPVLLLILNALILQERSQLSTADAFAIAVPPTLVGPALFFSCLGGTVATIVSEREQQTLKRLFLSPLTGISYFLGIFLAHAAIGLGQTALVYGIGAGQGATFAGNALLMLILLMLSIAAYVGVGFILGTQLARRTEDVNALISAFGVPLLILGGAFFPTSIFPDSLRNLAEFNPVYHMVTALTSVSADGEGIEAISSHFWFLMAFAGLMVGLGWLSYRRMVQVERQL